MTTLLQPQRPQSANDGHVRDNMTADERLLRKAVQRVLKAQVAEVYGRLTGGTVEKGGKDDEEGRWVTMHGSPVFIRDGQSAEDAAKERFGGSGPGGGFHGTAESSVASILKTGIRTSIPQRRGATRRSEIAGQPKGAYLAPTKHDAEWWGLMAKETGERLAIFEVKFSPGEYPLSEDRKRAGSYFSSKTIRPEHIVGVDLYNYKSEQVAPGRYRSRRVGYEHFDIRNGKLKKEVEKTFFIPVIMEEDEETKSLKATPSPTSAVPANIKPWDDMVMREVRPIWFGLFKKGGDKALQNIRKFPKHAKKMAVLSWAEMQASERVVVKGGAGSGNFGHEGRPGEVGGSGAGGALVETAIKDKVKEYAKQVKVEISSIVFADMPNKWGEYNPKTHEIRFDLKVLSLSQRLQEYVVLHEVVHASIPNHGILFKAVMGALMPDWVEREKELPHREKSFKAVSGTPSIVIPEWIEDPDVLDALEKEMFKFAHGINQTTADSLRVELMEGMENGETIPQLADRISGISDEWVEGWRSEMIARTETARAFTTGHIEAWKSTGVVSRVVWKSSGDACPFCLAMDGTVIELGENFFDQGEEQTADWKDQEIVMEHDYSDVNGPPLHPNCRCVLIGMIDETNNEEP